MAHPSTERLVFGTRNDQRRIAPVGGRPVFSVATGSSGLPTHTESCWPAPAFAKLGPQKAGTRHRLLPLRCRHWQYPHECPPHDLDQIGLSPDLPLGLDAAEPM